MIGKKRVTYILLSLLLVLSGCVFEEKEEKIILQVKSNDETRAVSLKQANYRQEYETVEEPIIGTKVNQVVYKDATRSDGISWLAAKVQEATDAKQEVTLIHTYNQFDEKISTISVPGSKKLTEATGTIYEYGQKPQIGAEWYPGFVTRYGYDCQGCSVTEEDFSGTASGIKLAKDKVRQANGQWKSGLTFDGLHIIATSGSIPLCTVVKISNHPFSGGGIVAHEPFYAIVGDRGVGGSSIDLFAGSEKNLSVISQTGSPRSSNTKVEIVGFRTHVRNAGCQ